ncbi:hypothetical protein ACFP3I_13325 [Chryseobacterium arachidis]
MSPINLHVVLYCIVLYCIVLYCISCFDRIIILSFRNTSLRDWF